MSDLERKNFAAIEQALNQIWREISTMKEAQTRVETQFAMLKQEMEQTKRMVILTRGTGPTER